MENGHASAGDECPLLFGLLPPPCRARAADLGRAFTPAVAAGMLGVRPAAARALWGNPTGAVLRGGVPWHPRWAGWMLEAAECCPPDWLPARGDTEGWRVFRNAAAAMADDGVLPGRPPADSLSGAGGRVPPGYGPMDAPGRAAVRAILSRMIRRAGRGWAASYRPVLHARTEAADTVRELAADLLAALLAAGRMRPRDGVRMADAAALAGSVLHHPRHPDAVRRAVERHHGRFAPMGVPAAPGPPSKWPPLLAGRSWSGPDGMHAEEIGTAGGLAEEGAAMEHCVRSYAWVCALGRGRILSVRTAAGTRVSTALLGRDLGGSVVLTQHSGFRNRPPPAAARAAVAALIEDCRARPGACDPLDGEAGAAKLVSACLGAGWRDPATLAGRWERWRAVLDIPPDPVEALLAHRARWPWPLRASPFSAALAR